MDIGVPPNINHGWPWFIHPGMTLLYIWLNDSLYFTNLKHKGYLRGWFLESIHHNSDVSICTMPRLFDARLFNAFSIWFYLIMSYMIPGCAESAKLDKKLRKLLSNHLSQIRHISSYFRPSGVPMSHHLVPRSTSFSLTSSTDCAAPRVGTMSETSGMGWELPAIAYQWYGSVSKPIVPL